MVTFGCAVEEPEEEVVPEGPIPREEVSVDVSYGGKEVEIAAGNALIVTLFLAPIRQETNRHF